MDPLNISTQQFRELSQRVLEITSRYLEELDKRKITPEAGATEVERLFQEPLPEIGSAAAAMSDLQFVARNSRAQNGRFFGYVLGSGDPVGAATDLLCSVLNQNCTAWRSAPAAIAIEREVIHWLGQAIDCPQFTGVLTGGGSMANLMGLAMAREAKALAHTSGLRNQAQRTVYASTEVHMSIPKAVSLLGIGLDYLRLIPVDKSYRMIPAELESSLRLDEREGFLPTAVVATAGTVSAGAIDPLDEIAAIAKKSGLWLHVDGSYGALAAIAAPEKFSGLAQADSVSLDPHKWLYQPLDCGCLLYRDAHAARAAFSHTGEYARVLNAAESAPVFEESLELSRRFRALKIWFSLRYHGLAAFRKAIGKDLRHALRLAEQIRQAPALELMAPVELSAVCFRYTDNPGTTEAQRDALNSAILESVNRRGTVYLSNAVLSAKFCLRACIVNHRTTDADVDAVVPEVLAVARRLREENERDQK